MKLPAVYLLATARRGTLYVGVTSDLVKRVWQHREGCIGGFTQRYRIKTLVWYERHGSMMNAIRRGKTIKRWERRWKLELVETLNPEWLDLWDEIASLRVGGRNMDPRFRGDDDCKCEDDDIKCSMTKPSIFRELSLRGKHLPDD